MDMPFLNDVWGEEDMFAIEGGITSGLSSPVLSSPSSPARHLAMAKGGSSPYPPSSSAFASACIAASAMDDPFSSTSPVSASPPASPSLIKRSLFVGSNSDSLGAVGGNGLHVTTRTHDASSVHAPKSDGMLDGPIVVETDYMEEEGAEGTCAAGAQQFHGDKERQKRENAREAEGAVLKNGVPMESAAKDDGRRSNKPEGEECMEDLRQAMKGEALSESKGAESMEVDDINRELVASTAAASSTATNDDGHDHQHHSPNVAVPMPESHLAFPDVPSTTVAEVTTQAEKVPETKEAPSATKVETAAPSLAPLVATVLLPVALPLAPQLLATTTTMPTTALAPLPTVPPEMKVPVAVTTPTASRGKPSAAAGKKTPTTPKAPVSKTVTLRVNTDREDFKRFASMTRDKLRQELKVRGLSVSGTKTDLYQRIVEAILAQEQKDSGVVGVVSNVKMGKVVKGKGAGGVRAKKEPAGRQQSRADLDEDDEEEEEQSRKKSSTSFAFPSVSTPGASLSGPFTPFSPFAPMSSSGFAVPLPSAAAKPQTPRKEKAAATDNALLSLDFDDEDALDIPLEESLMEELRKQEEREQKMGMTATTANKQDDEYRFRNGDGRDDDEDTDTLDDMSSDEDDDEGLLEDEEQISLAGDGVSGGRAAVVRRSHRSHHAPKDEMGETAMRRKENEEGLQEASKLTDIVLINDKIPKHLRTDDRYYYCKHCDRAWPKTSFRNAQQFGAHCSNCARRQIRRTPSLPRAVGSPVAVDGSRRLSVGRLNLRRSDDASPSLKSSRDLTNSGTRKLAKTSIQPMTLGRMKAENRGVFLWFDALPTDLIVRILSFLESSPRDLGAISASCHFFSIIAANDTLWRRMFEARWGTDLASHYSGTWRERFASRVFFLKAKTALPPVIPSPSALTSVAEGEASRLKEAWNGLLADPKLKARTVETVLAVHHATLLSSAELVSMSAKPMYLVQWAPADDNDSSAPEDRQRWVSEETMTVAPVVSLVGCSSALPGRKRRVSDYALSHDGGSSSSKRMRRQDGSDDDSSDSDDEVDSMISFDDLGGVSARKRKRRTLEDESDEDDDQSEDESSLLGEDSLDGISSAVTAADSQQLMRRKFEEGPNAKEARLKRKQLLRDKEERARKRRRKGRRQEAMNGGGDDGMNGANNDDVPLTKEDKERQQREFLRVLYNNRDYKPVILFFDRNA